MNLFRIRGIQLAVHGSFFLLLAYFGYEGWGVAGTTGAVWSIATILAFFACVVLHELGHSFTAMHYGINVRRILLMPIGGMAEFDSIPREPRKELLITLAGPAVNFVLAALLWLPTRHLSFDQVFATPATLYSAPGLLLRLFYANLIMGVFNLVPVFPMDGGRILRAILAWRLPYLRATRWAANVGKVLAIVGIFVMLYWGESILGACLFAFILFAGDMEYRAVRRREMEDAHWREMLARLYARSQPQPEPPIIDVTPR